MRSAWEKYERVLAQLRAWESVAVAFSGGVDSTLLLQAALTALGRERVLAVTAVSETYPPRELAAARSLAQRLQCHHLEVTTSELAIPGYAENPVHRCYFCKQELFSQLLPLAQARGYAQVVFGAIADDLGEYRPGLQAARERGVRAPLLEAGLNKREIRFVSRELGLPTWDKPSLACLSSRIPYGQRITLEKLSRIDQAEFFLQQLGFRQVRVRHHEQLARIEVPPEDLPQLVEVAAMVVQKLRGLGFTYVTLDLQGYRSGSLNEAVAVQPAAVLGEQA
ncbi:MAG: ATP-dependent sacrificial sulfur transferase LarE [Alicyclobacillus sp.]|nr:ATP-dependent sacrificial sulfur transferase LarE [Alicyclobacillus sp.]